MTTNSHFDYIIIGNGLAGLQLAYQLSKESFFDTKQIALIDKSNKSINDKTWCFWEQGNGQWDNIVFKSWHAASFISSTKHLSLKLKPYTYKMIRSLDFYKEIKSVLSKKDNIHFIVDEVIDVDIKDNAFVHTKNFKYTSNHIFDSRIPQEFKTDKNKYITIQQHFKGWVIKTDEDIFNTEEFTMMDYRLKDGDQTTFTYVLPFSANKALIEFTYFTPDLVKDDTYDMYLKQYISDILNIKYFDIVESESGNIPMTNFPFNKYSNKNLTKIGTAGGWVKGSTGYSFKHTEKKVAHIIENLKQEKSPSEGVFKRKYQFYDTVFLKVLKDYNHKGEWVFQQFYSKNSVKNMFEFLDEESSFKSELKIMSSLFSSTFIKAFFKTLWH